MASILSGIRQTALGTAAAADTSAVRTLNDRRLFEPTPLDDELDDALQTYVSNETRPRRDVPTAAEYMGRVYGYERFNQLVTGGQWRGLALAAESTILETPADQEHKLMKCWTYRTLALLQQQGCGMLAVAELDRLERATGFAHVARRAVVELGRSPTVVWPFELRLLRAQAPGVVAGDWAESIARLSALQRGCSRVLSRPSEGGDDASGEERIVLNRRRVFRLSLMIAACAANLGDSSVAVQTLDRLLPADSNDDESDVRLLSAAARLYLQLGGIAAAERLFLRVENFAPKDDKLVLMNQGFYAVATAKWDVARDLFARVFADHPDRIAAGNNAAVCELYLGSPQAMLNGLQQLMVASPAAAGTAEELVFNYCTGLDLHYDAMKLREAKIKKMIEVGMWAGDGFDMRSFKIHQ